jgi:hypothetical protein
MPLSLPRPSPTANLTKPATVLQTGQSNEQRTITAFANDYVGLLNLARASTQLPRSGLVQGML